MLSRIKSDVAGIFRDVKNGNIDFKEEKKRFIFSKFICLMHGRIVKAKELLRILTQNSDKGEFVRKIDKVGGFTNYLREQSIKDDINEQEFLDTFNEMKLILPQDTFLNLIILLTTEIIPFLYEGNWCFITP